MYVIEYDDDSAMENLTLTEAIQAVYSLDTTFSPRQDDDPESLVFYFANEATGVSGRVYEQ